MDYNNTMNYRKKQLLSNKNLETKPDPVYVINNEVEKHPIILNSDFFQIILIFTTMSVFINLFIFYYYK